MSHQILPPDQQGTCSTCGTRNACVVRCPTVVDRVLGAGADRVGCSPGVTTRPEGLAAMIDHTLLKPEAVREDFDKLCDEARRHEFASVCVNPYWVHHCAGLLARSRVAVCTVIGFPFGATPADVKAYEARTAQADGATELDMVLNVGALRSGDIETVRRDIAGVVRTADHRTIVKVILETAYLDPRRIHDACVASREAGADFVKTSTGYGPGGATVEDVALMRKTVGPEMGVKASGGIRDLATAQRMIAAGANRIGASASVKIVSSAG